MIYICIRQLEVILITLKTTDMTNLETTIGQSYATTWMNAINQILEGAKFNGTVYAKRVSTKNFDLSVYVDGEYISLGRFFREEVEEMKALFLSLLVDNSNKKEVKEVEKVKQENDANKTSKKNNVWFVDDRVIHNNLNYNQMVDMYGMCNFE